MLHWLAVRLQLVQRLQEFHALRCLLLTEQSSLLHAATVHVLLRLLLLWLTVVIGWVVHVHRDPVHIASTPMPRPVSVLGRKRILTIFYTLITLIALREQSIVYSGQCLLIINKQIKQVVLVFLSEIAKIAFFECRQFQQRRFKIFSFLRLWAVQTFLWGVYFLV